VFFFEVFFLGWGAIKKQKKEKLKHFSLFLEPLVPKYKKQAARAYDKAMLWCELHGCPSAKG
jgi:hypothetical protein